MGHEPGTALDQLRPARVIRQVHDLFEEVTLGNVPIELATDEDRKILNAMTNTLCWVLQHPGGETLANTLRAWTDDLAAHGFVLRDVVSGELTGSAAMSLDEIAAKWPNVAVSLKRLSAATLGQAHRDLAAAAAHHEQAALESREQVALVDRELRSRERPDDADAAT